MYPFVASAGVSNSFSVNSTHWKPPVGIAWLIAQPYKLFESKYMQVGGRLFRVVVFHLRIVGDGVPVTDHWDAPSQSLLDKKIHVRIGDKFERDIGALEEGIPRIAGEG